MNHRQYIETVKQVLIEKRWMFDTLQKQKESNVYKERLYNCSIIQSAFFFENLIEWLSLYMIYLYIYIYIYGENEN